MSLYNPVLLSTVILSTSRPILGPLYGLKNVPSVYWASNENELISLALELLNKLKRKEQKEQISLTKRKKLLEPSLDQLIKKWLGISSYTREYTNPSR